MTALVSIRPAGENDIPVIRGLARAIWPVTYGPILPSGQVEYMLELMYSTTALAEQMTAKGHHFILAEMHGHAVAFASYGRMPGGADRWRLHKLYVLPDRHGSGIGKRVLHAVEAACIAAGGRSLELNVNKENPARHFYRHQGFEVAREERIPIGGGFWMDDIVLERPVAPTTAAEVL